MAEIFAELNTQILQPLFVFPYLYQSLTVGEWWPVDPKRIAVLEKEGQIQKKLPKVSGKVGLWGHILKTLKNYGFKGDNEH